MENMENAGKKNNVSWRFLAKCATEKTPMTIFLRNGFQMRGMIAEFDDEVITVDVNGTEKMVNLSAISTIEPFVTRQHWANAPWGRETGRAEGFLPT